MAGGIKTELSVLIQIRLEKQRLRLVEEEQEKAIKQSIQNRRGTPRDTNLLKIKQKTVKMYDRFQRGYIEKTTYCVDKLE
jgi:hypothetical protein